MQTTQLRFQYISKLRAVLRLHLGFNRKKIFNENKNIRKIYSRHYKLK